MIFTNKLRKTILAITAAIPLVVGQGQAQAQALNCVGQAGAGLSGVTSCVNAETTATLMDGTVLHQLPEVYATEGPIYAVDPLTQQVTVLGKVLTIPDTLSLGGTTQSGMQVTIFGSSALGNDGIARSEMSAAHMDRMLDENAIDRDTCVADGTGQLVRNAFGTSCHPLQNGAVRSVFSSSELLRRDPALYQKISNNFFSTIDDVLNTNQHTTLPADFREKVGFGQGKVGADAAAAASTDATTLAAGVQLLSEQLGTFEAQQMALLAVDVAASATTAVASAVGFTDANGNLYPAYAGGTFKTAGHRFEDRATGELYLIPDIEVVLELSENVDEGTVMSCDKGDLVQGVPPSLVIDDMLLIMNSDPRFGADVLGAAETAISESYISENFCNELNGRIVAVIGHTVGEHVLFVQEILTDIIDVTAPVVITTDRHQINGSDVEAGGLFEMLSLRAIGFVDKPDFLTSFNGSQAFLTVGSMVNDEYMECANPNALTTAGRPRGVPVGLTAQAASTAASLAIGADIRAPVGCATHMQVCGIENGNGNMPAGTLACSDPGEFEVDPVVAVVTPQNAFVNAVDAGAAAAAAAAAAELAAADATAAELAAAVAAADAADAAAAAANAVLADAIAELSAADSLLPGAAAAAVIAETDAQIVVNNATVAVQNLNNAETRSNLTAAQLALANATAAREDAQDAVTDAVLATGGIDRPTVNDAALAAEIAATQVTATLNAAVANAEAALENAIAGNDPAAIEAAGTALQEAGSAALEDAERLLSESLVIAGLVGDLPGPLAERLRADVLSFTIDRDALAAAFAPAAAVVGAEVLPGGLGELSLTGDTLYRQGDRWIVEGDFTKADGTSDVGAFVIAQLVKPDGTRSEIGRVTVDILPVPGFDIALRPIPANLDIVDELNDVVEVFATSSDGRQEHRAIFFINGPPAAIPHVGTAAVLEAVEILTDDRLIIHGYASLDGGPATGNAVITTDQSNLQFVAPLTPGPGPLAGGFDYVERPIIGNAGFIHGETVTMTVAGVGSTTMLIDLSVGPIPIAAVARADVIAKTVAAVAAASATAADAANAAEIATAAVVTAEASAAAASAAAVDAAGFAATAATAATAAETASENAAVLVAEGAFAEAFTAADAANTAADEANAAAAAAATDADIATSDATAAALAAAEATFAAGLVTDTVVTEAANTATAAALAAAGSAESAATAAADAAAAATAAATAAAAADAVVANASADADAAALAAFLAADAAVGTAAADAAAAVTAAATAAAASAAADAAAVTAAAAAAAAESAANDALIEGLGAEAAAAAVTAANGALAAFQALDPNSDLAKHVFVIQQAGIAASAAEASVAAASAAVTAAAAAVDAEFAAAATAAAQATAAAEAAAATVATDAAALAAADAAAAANAAAAAAATAGFNNAANAAAAAAATAAAQATAAAEAAAAAALVVPTGVVIDIQFADNRGRIKVEGTVAGGLQVRADVAGVVCTTRASGDYKCEGRNLTPGQAVTFRAE